MLEPLKGRKDRLITDLFAEQRERLVRFAVSLTQDFARAEDLVQDAFVKAFTHAETLAQLNRYQRSAWLSRTLKNHFLDQQRVLRRAVYAPLEEAEKAQAEESFTMRFEYLQMMAQIPERYRALLELRYLQGYTSEEIGRSLGVPAATVRSRLRLAHEWMRAHRKKFE